MGQCDSVYAERDKLVAALSKIFPSWLERHPEEDTTWEDDWRNIVFIQIPQGVDEEGFKKPSHQVSWHIHDSELPMFTHLNRFYDNSWDGHTTEEKYERLSMIPKQWRNMREQWEFQEKEVRNGSVGAGKKDLRESEL